MDSKQKIAGKTVIIHKKKRAKAARFAQFHLLISDD
jgi:hypothetical protein